MIKAVTYIKRNEKYLSSCFYYSRGSLSKIVFLVDFLEEVEIAPVLSGLLQFLPDIES